MAEERCSICSDTGLILDPVQSSFPNNPKFYNPDVIACPYCIAGLSYRHTDPDPDRAMEMSDE
jgi:hypothetical protein